MVPNLAPSRLYSTADPAGSARNPHGSKSGIDILREHDIFPFIVEDANQPPRQDAAINLISGYLERAWFDGTPCSRWTRIDS